jgi:hypothetical protein
LQNIPSNNEDHAGNLDIGSHDGNKNAKKPAGCAAISTDKLQSKLTKVDLMATNIQIMQQLHILAKHNLIVQQEKLKCTIRIYANVKLQGDYRPGDIYKGGSVAGYMRPCVASG